MKSSDKLYYLLREIDLKADKEFSGLGIVLYENLSNLQFTSLGNMRTEIFLPILSRSEIVDFLVKNSTLTSKYHDGFSFLNRSFELTHISQYISPPILKNVNVQGIYGSRFRTAIYTSALPGIIACGVLSTNYPPTVFVDGKQIRESV